MAEAQPISSPMASSCKLTKTGSDLFSDPTLYRSVVGALQYLTITRPEINYSMNKVCQFMANPLDSHWISAKRILRYLKGTVSQGLHLRPAVLGKLFVSSVMQIGLLILKTEDPFLVLLSTLVLISSHAGPESSRLLQDLVQRQNIEVWLRLLLKYLGFRPF